MVGENQGRKLLQLACGNDEELVDAAWKPSKTVGAQISWGVRFDSMEDANGLVGANTFLNNLSDEVSKVRAKQAEIVFTKNQIKLKRMSI